MVSERRERLRVALHAVGWNRLGRGDESPGAGDARRVVCVYSSPSSSPADATRARARRALRRIATMAIATRANTRSPRSKAVITGLAGLDWFTARLTVVGLEDEPFPVPPPDPEPPE